MCGVSSPLGCHVELACRQLVHDGAAIGFLVNYPGPEFTDISTMHLFCDPDGQQVGLVRQPGAGGLDKADS